MFSTAIDMTEGVPEKLEGVEKKKAPFQTLHACDFSRFEAFMPSHMRELSRAYFRKFHHIRRRPMALNSRKRSATTLELH